MLDFTADWCSTCRELEHKTFSDPAVRRELRGWRVLRAEVTGSTKELPPFQLTTK